MAIDLNSISTSTPKKPRITIYGTIGVGKTSFAADAENPIFILTEDGLGDIPAKHFPMAKSFQDVLDMLRTLGKETHDYKTVVIDSLDWLEPLVWDATCKRLGVPTIESPGYGKGYVETLTEWREFFKYITALRDYKNMTIIMIAHGAVKRIEDPIHPAYDMHGFKLDKRASALAEEYSDIIGFAATKTLITTEDTGFGQKRNRALVTDERVLHLTGTPAFVAKNRYHMPDQIPLKYSEFAASLPTMMGSAKKAPATTPIQEVS